MSAGRRWSRYVPPASAVVVCNGEEHRVAWVNGKVVIEDHDVAAERTMLAFGGELPACLKVLELWRNCYSWALSTELFRQVQDKLGPEALLAPGDLRDRNQLGLMLTWERAWRRTAYFSEHGRFLHEHMRPRVMGPLREHLTFWMGRHGCRRIAAADLRVARVGEPVRLEGSMDSVSVRATLVVSATWFVRVWARGIAVVDGGLVLDVGAGDALGVAVRAARWDEAVAGVANPLSRPAHLRRVGGTPPAWRLVWDDAGPAVP